MTKTRHENLMDLADSIRELTEPRHHTEYVELTVVETVTRRGRTRERRRRERRAHIIELPGLLQALAQAARPGSSDASGTAAGGFESRPSAELEPLSVLREITDDMGFWARTFSIERVTLAGNLSALVSAPHDDPQLEHIANQARRWVRRARMATGFDPAPMTLSEPCPYCHRRHALTISGDMQRARCNRCGVDWTPDTIGLLADMLRANETQETMTDPRCVWPQCPHRGPHDVHQDGYGRTFPDRCDVPTPIASGE